ncbi:hypothetical protein GCM10027275_16670 [Rhabdobacter roseus]|uniref:Uncharacterized protein n=1 Tax=Rhabdobacter roseus TaxID=1655419 RepID=A0A840TV92_9BACT|nr:hypothetical protein [Rhabdobacter roseus]MBB5283589.1 hypothetical protein [Rhabdobacter roseus]
MKLDREQKIALLELAREGQYDPSKHRSLAEIFKGQADGSHYDLDRLSSVERELLQSLILKAQGESPGEPYTGMLNAAEEAAEASLRSNNASFLL